VFGAVNKGNPHTLLALEERLDSEEASAQYLAALRWPSAWICPSSASRVAEDGDSTAMSCLSRRDRISGQSPAAANLVSRHVVSIRPEERNQGLGLLRVLGLGKLQDDLGHAA
jgi:hypothetical protein